VKTPQPDDLIFMDKARVMPNGDLLAIYEAAGDTPWGYGMVKLDRNSNVIWRYLEPTHHDFDLAPDGRIFALTQEFTSEEIKGFTHLARPRLDDFLVTLSADGKELKKISLTHALAQSSYDDFLHATPAFSAEDPLHTNAVQYIDRAKAKRLAVGREGLVLVSFRDIGVLAIIDPGTGEVVWATRGPWLGQHDPRALDDGDILLFDNFGGFQKGNASRVLEFDPKTMKVTWQYAGGGDHPFVSEIRGSAQRLANGNTLITESDGGRLFEVTPDGRIVWEYVNPVRGGGGEGSRFIPVVTGGQRIPPDRFDPAFRAVLDQKTETSP
jgi:outer membrane protein assembly factor BamB